MKVKIELNIINNDMCYLNFWDSMHGNDVIYRWEREHGLFFTEGNEASY